MLSSKKKFLAGLLPEKTGETDQCRQQAHTAIENLLQNILPDTCKHGNLEVNMMTVFFLKVDLYHVHNF